ncbi:unnamed protein product [Mesocestoides corti]|uniref:Uncharacterized protein n=1 Tax=Mesocestoides corti TaxID=53468 RepID=A0A0R3UME3_MESCO|nr:unnamed protein product [Mesocestoides corti]
MRSQAIHHLELRSGCALPVSPRSLPRACGCLPSLACAPPIRNLSFLSPSSTSSSSLSLLFLCVRVGTGKAGSALSANRVSERAGGGARAPTRADALFLPRESGGKDTWEGHGGKKALHTRLLGRAPLSLSRACEGGKAVCSARALTLAFKVIRVVCMPVRAAVDSFSLGTYSPQTFLVVAEMMSAAARFFFAVRPPHFFPRFRVSRPPCHLHRTFTTPPLPPASSSSSS